MPSSSPLPPVVDDRTLNRTTLARQLLLERSATTVVDTVEQVVGMQAQVPQNPYVGLWSRLTGFQPPMLEGELVDRRLVRIVTLRGTVHLHTADDCLVLRPLVQPVMEREMGMHRDHRDTLATLDLEPALAFARRVLADGPVSNRRLRDSFAAEFPDVDPATLVFATRNRLAFVQTPPRGLWSASGEVAGTTTETWLGRPIDPAPDIDAVMLRYLAAFGPASVGDASAWSGLTGLREVFERLRPRLVAYRAETGRELFDVAGGELVAADRPAPVRLLPEYDNVLLSHDDRSRFVADDDRRRLSAAPDPVRGTILVDGRGAGGWRMEPALPGAKLPDDGTATIHIQLLDHLADDDAAALDAEARDLVTFVHPSAAVRVSITVLAR